MKTLNEVLNSGLHGLYYGNRILLPFRADILKAIIENDIITDFSSNSSNAEYNIYDDFTEIYFYDYKDISEDVTEFETIKLVLVEFGEDIFDFKNHRKIALHVKEHHKLEIEELNDDILLIE